MGKTFRIKDVSAVDGSVRIKIHASVLGARLELAQYWLDSQIMNDMEPLMPRNDSTFINLTRAQSAALAGSGRVIAAAPPFGRFLYNGKVMIDPVTKSPWARKGAKKILTDQPLNLTHGNPKAVPKWFEAAKDAHLQDWMNGVKEILEGRTRGNTGG